MDPRYQQTPNTEKETTPHLQIIHELRYGDVPLPVEDVVCGERLVGCSVFEIESKDWFTSVGGLSNFECYSGGIVN